VLLDPRRAAILLIMRCAWSASPSAAGWQEFYERMIPLADDLLDEHLAALQREGPRDT
jgi:hypothetical protein